ncbi:hypothetical protein BLNAU_17011 [Blattamonas nauphoetae]|uniref:Uncharacterized protein n=1 Tax=Blattamonas nauphoetae TaxID=2049346 RepID=A0ABQ9X8P9_9EUKA|nr:hypothetical protein BLNAU_17011 [Blattamonas nauphoetae]
MFISPPDEIPPFAQAIVGIKTNLNTIQNGDYISLYLSSMAESSFIPPQKMNLFSRRAVSRSLDSLLNSTLQNDVSDLSRTIKIAAEDCERLSLQHSKTPIEQHSIFLGFTEQNSEPSTPSSPSSPGDQIKNEVMFSIPHYLRGDTIVDEDAAKTDLSETRFADLSIFPQLDELITSITNSTWTSFPVTLILTDSTPESILKQKSKPKASPATRAEFNDQCEGMYISHQPLLLSEPVIFDTTFCKLINSPTFAFPVQLNGNKVSDLTLQCFSPFLKAPLLFSIKQSDFVASPSGSTISIIPATKPIHKIPVTTQISVAPCICDSPNLAVEMKTLAPPSPDMARHATPIPPTSDATADSLSPMNQPLSPATTPIISPHASHTPPTRPLFTPKIPRHLGLFTVAELSSISPCSSATSPSSEETAEITNPIATPVLTKEEEEEEKEEESPPMDDTTPTHSLPSSPHITSKGPESPSTASRASFSSLTADSPELISIADLADLVGLSTFPSSVVVEEKKKKKKSMFGWLTGFGRKEPKNLNTAEIETEKEQTDERVGMEEAAEPETGELEAKQEAEEHFEELALETLSPAVLPPISEEEQDEPVSESSHPARRRSKPLIFQILTVLIAFLRWLFNTTVVVGNKIITSIADFITSHIPRTSKSSPSSPKKSLKKSLKSRLKPVIATLASPFEAWSVLEIVLLAVIGTFVLVCFVFVCVSLFGGTMPTFAATTNLQSAVYVSRSKNKPTLEISPKRTQNEYLRIAVTGTNVNGIPDRKEKDDGWSDLPFDTDTLSNPIVKHGNSLTFYPTDHSSDSALKDDASKTTIFKIDTEGVHAAQATFDTLDVNSLTIQDDFSVDTHKLTVGSLLLDGTTNTIETGSDLSIVGTKNVKTGAKNAAQKVVFSNVDLDLNGNSIVNGRVEDLSLVRIGEIEAASITTNTVNSETVTVNTISTQSVESETVETRKIVIHGTEEQEKPKFKVHGTTTPSSIELDEAGHLKINGDGVVIDSNLTVKNTLSVEASSSNVASPLLSIGPSAPTTATVSIVSTEPQSTSSSSSSSASPVSLFISGGIVSENGRRQTAFVKVNPQQTFNTLSINTDELAEETTILVTIKSYRGFGTALFKIAPEAPNSAPTQKKAERKGILSSKEKKPVVVSTGFKCIALHNTGIVQSIGVDATSQQALVTLLNPTSPAVTFSEADVIVEVYLQNLVDSSYRLKVAESNTVKAS